MTRKVDADALAAAVDALGDVMMAMQARHLLARGCRNDVIRAKLEADAITDEAIGKLASSAFQAGVEALAEAGDPNVSVHRCNPKEEP